MAKRNSNDHPYSWGSKFVDRHPVFANFAIILIISTLGIYAAYLAAALFTKHGRSVTVPGVENISYTQAVERLHDAGLMVDIRDSLYRDNVRPGFVIEQFPKANSIVKPGRKIFLYINAVHPKEVILDDDNHPNDYALKGVSHRTAIAKFEELGFKNVRVVKVLGATDRVVKVLANGRPVRKMQKVPVNASIVLEVSDGRLADIQDSLRNLEYLREYNENVESYGGTSSSEYESSEYPAQSESPSHQYAEPENQEENNMYF
ncbi:MAG: PASTA domain-containing protein [Candidatus Amulumruptor caecigallinarius]|nr:PASTA domain-containing protein [Candidatus Amulumruptor caecigallinarius]